MKIDILNKKGKIEFLIDGNKAKGKGIFAELKNGFLVSFVDGKKHVTTILNDVNSIKLIKSKKDLKKLLNQEIEIA